MRAASIVLLATLAFAPGCVAYDLAGAPSKDLGVGHIYERLPIAVKVGFRDRSQQASGSEPRCDSQPLSARLIARASDSFTTSLRRTDLFDRVISGTGDRCDVGFEGEVKRLDCTQNYACIWCFYSVFALIAVPANLPLSVDDASYELVVRAVVPQTGEVVGTYEANVRLHSWRGAWTFYETWLDDPGQVFDRANQAILNQVVDDYPKFRRIALLPPDVARGEVK